jgi:IMP dehydrogenase
MEEKYTFDDVLLIPSYSEILPYEVSTSTFLTKDIELNIPIISAAMDRVTESELAIAVAKQGGLGVIHKNMSIKSQSLEVRKVKKYESWIVSNPITISPDASIQDVLELKQKHNYSGLPVVDENNNLLGILTNRDVRFIEDQSAQVKDIMTKDNLITVKKGISHTDALKLLHKHKIERLIVVNENFECVGLITVKDIQRLNKYPNSCKDKKSRLRVGAAIGIEKTGLERAESLVNEGVDALFLDSAHAHTKIIRDFILDIKKNLEVDLVAGNIVTKEAAEFLIKAGVDAVKVGLGPGSICTTRVIAGVGVPQLSAIMDVASVCKKYGIGIIADGGIRYSGDLAKAIAAGADCVMIGSLLAGTTETPGEVTLYQGRSYKNYRGMGSIGAMNDGSADRYFQNSTNKLVPEGVEGLVPFKGSVKDVIYQLVGGLRSAMGYTGNDSIKNMQEKSKFVRITNSSYKESHPHNVLITHEAPNYHKD